MTCSNDSSIVLNRFGNDRLIKKRLLRIEIEEKANDMVVKDYQNILVGDINGLISLYNLNVWFNEIKIN